MCIARPRPGLAPKRRPTPIPPAPAQSPTPATGGPGVEWRPRLPPSTDRAASVWDPGPDVSGLPADIITRVSKYLTFVTRHDPKTPATVELCPAGKHR